MLEGGDKTYAVVQDGNAILRLVVICLEIHIFKHLRRLERFFTKQWLPTSMQAHRFLLLDKPKFQLHGGD